MISALTYLALVLTAAAVVLTVMWYRLTRARAVLCFTGGFVVWCAIKIGLVAGVGFVVTYSGVLAAIIGVLMVAGLWLFLHDLRKFYRNGDNGKS